MTRSLKLTRREALALGGAALTGTMFSPRSATAQTPKRGGYYVQIHSGLSVAAWENALKNYAPNLGLDLGGRLTAAWLER